MASGAPATEQVSEGSRSAGKAESVGTKGSGRWPIWRWMRKFSSTCFSFSVNKRGVHQLRVRGGCKKRGDVKSWPWRVGLGCDRGNGAWFTKQRWGPGWGLRSKTNTWQLCFTFPSCHIQMLRCSLRVHGQLGGSRVDFRVNRLEGKMGVESLCKTVTIKMERREWRAQKIEGTVPDGRVLGLKVSVGSTNCWGQGRRGNQLEDSRWWLESESLKMRFGKKRSYRLAGCSPRGRGWGGVEDEIIGRE